MTLTLKIQNVDRLNNGSPTELVLHNRGAIIGRSQMCDWPLPDEERVLSREHCKIVFSGGAYILEDTSANGTYIGNGREPLNSPHRLEPGDIIRVGSFNIEAKFTGDALYHHETEQQNKAPLEESANFSNWDGPDFSGDPDPDEGLGTSPPTDFPESGGNGWDMPSEEKSDISSWADKPTSGPLEPSADKIFDTLCDSHEVDWSDTSWDVEGAVGRFEDPVEKTPEQSALSALEVEPSSDWMKTSADNKTLMSGLDDIDAPAAEMPDKVAPVPVAPHSAPAPPVTPASPATQAVASDNSYELLMSTIGISTDKLTGTPQENTARAGRMLRRLLAGLMKLLEARARAKDAMGTESTQLNISGNNPLKFAPDLEKAIHMMMNPAMKGYLEADDAIEDSYRDLQAHQIATLKAIQGALQATLNRFSPGTIKAQAQKQGMLSKIVRGKRDAALWKVYEKEFSGCVEGSSEAFFDTFSKEFKKAYEEASSIK
ncbi:MAG: type VI secretion system-associated FHA domain protein TagH [Hellea sp.]|nr:type VI secretion system-associated FHA domain protein TagH [Hellea sp.]